MSLALIRKTRIRCGRSPPGCAPEILSSIIDRANALDNPIESRNWKKVVGYNIVSVEVGCVYSSLVRDRYSNRQRIREGQVSLWPADRFARNREELTET